MSITSWIGAEERLSRGNPKPLGGFPLEAESDWGQKAVFLAPLGWENMILTLDAAVAYRRTEHDVVLGIK